jgi:hypothetical protein
LFPFSDKTVPSVEESGLQSSKRKISLLNNNKNDSNNTSSLEEKNELDETTSREYSETQQHDTANFSKKLKQSS